MLSASRKGAMVRATHFGGPKKKVDRNEESTKGDGALLLDIPITVLVQHVHKLTVEHSVLGIHTITMEAHAVT
jgi:hypothetical protein